MESGLVARHGGRAGVAALVAILLLGLGLRLGEAWDGRAPVYDAAAYAAIARNLDEGNGFTVGAGATQPSSNYSPGVPLFVAGLYELTGGANERLARVVLATIGALSVLLAYLIARRLGRLVNLGRYSAQDSPTVWPALAGALMVAVYPALLEYQGMLMGEPLAATLLAGGVLATLWAWEGDWARWLLPGALFGALALARPEYLGVAGLVALVVLAREVRLDWRASLLRAAVFLAAAFVLIAPWALRNAIALDRFVPISTGGGQVLYAGTYLPSGGNPERVGAAVVTENPQLFSPGDAQRLRLEQILARLAHSRYPELEADQALSKMGKEQLWDDITEAPGESLAFAAKKVWRVWGHGPRDVMHQPAWTVFHWLLVALALFGLGVLAWQRRWEALLLGTIFLAITLLSAVLVASPRRVLVLVPLLAALAGAALAWLTALRGSASAGRHTKPGRPADALPGPIPE